MKLKIITLTLMALMLTSCTAGPNPLEGVPDKNGNVAGFWNGLWDGMITPITFVISLFNHDVEIYNPNSNGWYPFGYVIGVGALGGGASKVKD